ncbi:MAG: response regulator [Planctomycetota bacterium]|jgi:putative two-component system response regulator|nr:response regulator [Planctomycetota bacterium]
MTGSAKTHKTRIMVVDDDITNLKYAKTALSEIYDVFTVPSAAKMFGVIDALAGDLPALILLDIIMPEMDGMAAIKILKSGSETRNIPVIFLTSRNDPSSEAEGLSLGAIDYISKPFQPHLLRKRVEIHLTLELQRQTLERQKLDLLDFNENLRRMVEEKTGRMMELQGAILSTVADLVENRDDITGGHVQRTKRQVGILMAALQDFGLYREETVNWDIDLLVQSSQLHDVGKISIRDNILMKPGKLTPDEFEAIKRHTVIGANIIDKIGASVSESDFLRHSRAFAIAHHEKWDGTGYPEGLRGEDIPLQGRLLAIADVYDALISDRPYKKAFSHDEAVSIIIDGSGTHFDPVLINVFKEMKNQFRSGD